MRYAIILAVSEQVEVVRGRPGTSEAALDSVELALGRALPASLRAVYRIHDGQAYDVHTPPLHGLFGW